MSFAILGRYLKIEIDAWIDYFEESELKSGKPSGANWSRVKEGFHVSISESA